MRWTTRRTNLAEWHPWFAWIPIDIDGTWVWLEKIERKIHFGVHDDYPYYRFPKAYDRKEYFTRCK